jgi:hypothetical protein
MDVLSTQPDEITLSYLGIHTIAPDAFANATNIVYLDLEHNDLTTIDNTTFTGLPQLQKYDRHRAHLLHHSTCILHTSNGRRRVISRA